MQRIIVTVALLLSCAVTIAADDLEPVKLPDLGESRLVLPWSDFKGLVERLLERATPPAIDENLPEYALSEVRLAGLLSEGSARVEARLTVHVLKQKGSVLVPVAPPDLPLAQATVEGKPAAISGEKAMQCVILPAGPRAHTINLVFYAQVDNSEGPSAITFPVPEAPVATLDFFVPQKNLQFSLQPRGHVETREEGRGSRAYAVLPAGQITTLSWGEKILEEKGQRATEEVTVSTLVTIAEDSLKFISTLSFRIRRGSVRSLSFELPVDVAITAVTGTGAQPFTTEDAGGRRRVDVGLNFDVKGSYQLSVSYERSRREAAGSETLPVLAVPSAVRQVTQVGVAAPSQMEVAVDEANIKDMRAIDVEELPAEITAVSAQPILFAFSSVRRDFALPLRVTTHPPTPVLAASIPMASLDTLITREGGQVTRAVYQVTNSSMQFLRLKLPAQATLWSARVSGRPVKPARDESDGSVLIPLEMNRTGPGAQPAFPVEILYQIAGKPVSGPLGRLALAAPIQNVNANRVDWRLHLPEGFRYTHFCGDFVVPRGGRLEDGAGDITLVTGSTNTLANLDGAHAHIPVQQKTMPLKRAVMENAIAIDDLRLQAAEQQGFSRGTLPIEVSVDFSGIEVPANRLVVPAGQGGEFRLWYFSAGLLDLVHRAAQACILVLAFVLLLAVYTLARTGRFGMNRLRWTLLVLSFVGLALFHFLFDMWVPNPPLAFAIAGAVLVLNRLVAWMAARKNPEAAK